MLYMIKTHHETEIAIIFEFSTARAISRDFYDSPLDLHASCLRIIIVNHLLGLTGGQKNNERYSINGKI